MTLVILCALLGLASASPIKSPKESFILGISSFSLSKCMNSSQEDHLYYHALQLEVQSVEVLKLEQALEAAKSNLAQYKNARAKLLAELKAVVDKASKSGQDVSSDLVNLFLKKEWSLDGITEALKVSNLLGDVLNAPVVPYNEGLTELTILSYQGEVPKSGHLREKRSWRKRWAEKAFLWACKFLKVLTETTKFEKHIVKYIMSKIPAPYRSEALQVLLDQGIYGLTNYARTLCGQPKIQPDIDLSLKETHQEFIEVKESAYQKALLVCYDQMNKLGLEQVNSQLENFSDSEATELKRLLSSTNDVLRVLKTRLPVITLVKADRNLIEDTIERATGANDVVLTALNHW